MIKKSTLLFTFFTIISFVQIEGQNKLNDAIKTLEEKYAQEKVYLLFDKQHYISGENIGFKAYVFEGYSRSNLSKTLFVELYDKEKNLIDQKTILLNNGEGDGSLQIKNNLKEDVYFVRAHTPWMENFSQEFNYIKPIPIYNPASSQRLTKESTSAWSVSASPEGGNLINNVPTNIAVRVLSENQITKNWNGYLIDSANPNEKVTNFTALDENVALFNFTPKKGHNYQVVVQNVNGETQTTNLPAILESGTSIAIKNTDNGINYTIKGTNSITGLKGYKVVGTVGNALVYQANLNSNSREISSSISSKVNDENNGVLQIAVFDDKDNLVAQRLSFIKPKGNFIGKPELKEMRLSSKPRSINSFNILPNESLKEYTVVVRDHNNIDEKNTQNENFISALWLTEDFKNPIQAPYQYFTANADPKALDALMISEKWTRFNWNSILSGSTTGSTSQPQKYLSYKGRLAINSRPLPNTDVNLILKTDDENASSLLQLTSDLSGDIYLNEVTINRPITIYYYLNPENKNNKESVPDNLTLNFTSQITPSKFKGELPKTNYVLSSAKVKNSEAITNAIINKRNKELINKDEIQIAEVVIKAKKQDLKQKLDYELSSGQFRDINSTVFDFVNENQNAVTYSSILQWLQGRVAGLTIQIAPNGTLVPFMRGEKAGVYIDEISIDAASLNTVNISDIAMVKIIHGGGLVGNAIAVYLRKGNMGSMNVDKKNDRNNKTQLIAYNEPYSYDAPDYSKDLYRKISNDTRELLYFNPTVTKTSNTPIQIKFYNNDHAKAYDVTIIGIDKNDTPVFFNEVITP